MKIPRLPFRTEMARAWHLDLKDVTRRLVKPQPVDLGHGWFGWMLPKPNEFTDHHHTNAEALARLIAKHAPYPAGSIVAIGEPIRCLTLEDVEVERISQYEADHRYVVDETGYKPIPWEKPDGTPYKTKRLSGMYCPNWAIRSWARIKSVRVERLQDITLDDIQREGLAVAPQYELGMTSREGFAAYIDHINGKGTWAANPWVFRYELERLDHVG